MNWRAYIPSGPKLSQEVIATLFGIVGAAIIIAQWPALKKFVKDNSIN